MPIELVERAIETSRTREPLVTVMCLAYGSRVLATADREAATRAYEEAVSRLDGLTVDQLDPHFLQPRHRPLVEIQLLGLGVEALPQAAAAFYRQVLSRDCDPMRRMLGGQIVQALAQAGDFEGALELLENPGFDQSAAMAVLSNAADAVVQRRAMDAARKRWQAIRAASDPRYRVRGWHDYCRVLSSHWQTLPSSEVVLWLDELLTAMESAPDYPMDSRLSDSVEFHSLMEMNLFELLPLLRNLKTAEQTDAILRRYPKVAEASQRYPFGSESIKQERQRQKSNPIRPEGGWIAAGLPDEIRLDLLIKTEAETNPEILDYLIDEAHSLFREDTSEDDPNLAPRVFWPSTSEYRMAMYFAGKQLGLSGMGKLDRIPDPDIALLASIELAAGALGLPRSHSAVMFQRHDRPSRGGPVAGREPR